MQHEKKKSQKFYYKKHKSNHQTTTNPTENTNPTKMLRQILIHNPTETVLQENNNKSTNYICTNQRTIGLISADRSNKATLLLTIPRSKFKSSAKDLSSLIFEVIIQGIR